MKQRPIVLCIGGHDPTGGAGIQADIETVTALGGRATTLVTALTAQDTHNVAARWPTPAPAFAKQFDQLVADIDTAAIKIGMPGDAALVVELARRLRDVGGPVVLDPVLAAGGGFDLADQRLVDVVREQLLPRCTLVTPNRAEARRLSGCNDSDAAVEALLDAGAGAVLLTGADEAVGDRVINRLSTTGRQRDYSWRRLPGGYHGSGCTLASACATLLAHGRALDDAVGDAQSFTHRALERAIVAGRGQRLPERLI